MIRQAQTQRSDPNTLKYTTELDLPIPLAVPLRKDNNGEILSTWKESSPYGIVFGIRCVYGAWKLQDFAIEFVCRRRLTAVEAFAVSKGARDVVLQGGR